MGNRTRRYVICYDVADDRRRRRLADCLDAYGDRVQESVFEAVLDRRLFDIVVSEVTEIMHPREDLVTVYPLCAACERARLDLGLAEGAERPGEEEVFIV